MYTYVTYKACTNLACTCPVRVVHVRASPSLTFGAHVLGEANTTPKVSKHFPKRDWVCFANTCTHLRCHVHKNRSAQIEDLCRTICAEAKYSPLVRTGAAPVSPSSPKGTCCAYAHPFSSPKGKQIEDLCGTKVLSECTGEWHKHSNIFGLQRTYVPINSARFCKEIAHATTTRSLFCNCKTYFMLSTRFFFLMALTTRTFGTLTICTIVQSTFYKSFARLSFTSFRAKKKTKCEVFQIKKNVEKTCFILERKGFEPSVHFHIHSISNRALSTTQTSLHIILWKNFIFFFI